MELFAVAGNPVFHSRSPFIFNSLFKQTGRKAFYTRLSAAAAGEVIDKAAELRFKGLNVTAPFKGDITAYVDELSPEASATGMVNTILFEDEIIKGYNTDHTGVNRSLENAGVNPRGSKALVIGAGGAGLAAAYGLVSSGAEVTIVNRDPEKAKRAAEKLGCGWSEFKNLGRIVRKAEIIVYTFPPGVVSGWTRSVAEGAALLDANYHMGLEIPPDVLARIKYISGLDWLLRQALESYRIFTGVEASGDMIPGLITEIKNPPARRFFTLTGVVSDGEKERLETLLEEKKKKTGESCSEVDTVSGLLSELESGRDFKRMRLLLALNRRFEPDEVSRLRKLAEFIFLASGYEGDRGLIEYYRPGLVLTPGVSPPSTADIICHEISGLV